MDEDDLDDHDEEDIREFTPSLMHKVLFLH